MSTTDHAIALSPREQELADAEQATTVAYGLRNMNWRGKRAFRKAVARATATVEEFYRRALEEKVCYYGPFVGEFGHFLLHNLPFLSHLHREGVAIHYCGMELHKPFLVDDKGGSIVASWTALRDFFGEVKPLCNETVLPDDVQAEVDTWRKAAATSGMPFLDISDKDLYWWVFRNWQLDGRQHRYDLRQVYAREEGRVCVVFPRKKGGATTPNNGGPWDYAEVARILAPHFDEVRLVGHPSLSAEVPDEANIRLCTSANNADTLRHCASAALIVTQHSGAVHLGAYVDAPVLLIFNGDPPIKGLIDTLRFRKNIAQRPLAYAFSLDEIKTFVAAQEF